MTTFEERHKLGAFYESYIHHEFQLRGYEVIDERLERRVSPYGMGVLRNIRALCGGADFMVISGRDGDTGWLVDCKAYTGRCRQVPGRGTYPVSARALYQMETHMRLRNLRGCFVLGDQWVVTTAEVRDHGRKAAGARANFYWVDSKHGRSFDHVFGEPNDGFPIAQGQLDLPLPPKLPSLDAWREAA